MQLNSYECPCCEEKTYLLEFSHEEAFMERQGGHIEFDKEQLQWLLYSIQRALLNIPMEGKEPANESTSED